MQPLHCDLRPEGQQTNRTTHTWTTIRCRTRWRHRLRSESRAAAPAAHTRYLSSPAEGTSHEKAQGFVLLLSPRHKSHATFMQPLHCDLRPESQQTQRTKRAWTTTRCRTWWRNRLRSQSRAAAPAAHTRYLSLAAEGTSHGKAQGFVLLFPPSTSPMQHSRSHYTEICDQTVNKGKELRTHEQPFVAERGQPRPPHTRGTFHRRPKALYTEKHKVSCYCFPPSTSPMQHSRSHYTEICDQRINKRKELRTHEQPAPNGAQPHPPHTRGTLHRRPKALHTEKHKVSCCCFPPNTSPMQHSCSHYIAICDQRVNKRIELRTTQWRNRFDLERTAAAPAADTHTHTHTHPHTHTHTHEVPFIAGCSHFARKNTRFRAPAFPPNFPTTLHWV